MEPPPPLSWKETRARMRADRERLLLLLSRWKRPRPEFLALHPCYLCVVLHRISHHFFRRGHRLTARFFWQLNTMLTGADISISSDIGAGLVITHPAGVAVAAKAGRNLTLGALAGLGGETGKQQDVGAGPGIPVLGDDVSLEAHSGVLGGLKIGNRVHIEAGCCADKDLADDTLLQAAPNRCPRQR